MTGFAAEAPFPREHDLGRIAIDTAGPESAHTRPNDLFIAAHALTEGLTLVSDNVKEFGRIDGLALENWRSLT